ncbi:ornithine carbamoyltransferase [Buchnera aphidicola]|jgi:ornithine carbamoyltransferase|uniref:Ornithine carbamoyltransferase n=1 Tax=Buchnera aphidicola subsp. Schizaphis graminum (strain Sg) TaxID=198804 RepID=OTC_BUCAP|nr:ornithine carbamoyltransferase [Buchnera aphidicola]P59100.1 RecName: Full=Ornithine carbamoyltransferase; Short=OTCase [Buchnera aphidicola str. Sg (Schizaphis graminum)]AAM67909.1 ornithine carbamoyltransferase chain F [Buchnera aphidicola str. Sg (Schizaphis graminum)]AWI49597.1 ornithine carbamoyltransferase [Buchnera aphidicola (Schizaphis graminum)]
MNCLYQRDCLRLLDFTTAELKHIITLSEKLKKTKQNRQEIKLLKQKNIALIFEKESTRTRCSFEVAAFDQGANVTYLGPGSTHLGTKESIEDTARVLSRLYDGIQYRGHNHKTIEILAQYSTVPVWNGLTEKFHPTQLIADLLTIKEIFPNRNFSDIKCAYVGDSRNNIGNSLLEAASIVGLNLYLVSPKQYWPEKNLFIECKKIIKKNQGNIICTENISEGVKNADFIYTDVWVSMGEHHKIWKERIELLKNYQVNDSMIKMTNNSKVKILHCLPALHDQKTSIGKSILKKYGLKDGMEITDNIFQKHQKTIFEQAENRLHTIKALLVSSLIKEMNF